MKKGFTLIELLVVVAIIALIGAGVAVSYNSLDERAKIAVELNDCGTLQKTISHWSALHDFTLPDRLDSLIDSNGRLYSILENGHSGLVGQGCWTLSVESAPSRLIDNLKEVGIETVYLHLTDRSPANDSTFTTGLDGNEIIVKETRATLSYGTSSARSEAQALLATEPEGLWWDYEEDGPYIAAGRSFATLSEYRNALIQARETLDAKELSSLVFIDPDTAIADGANAAQNISAAIISQLNLTDEDIARPSEDADEAIANGHRYWLVVFGLGRFANLYEGNSVRVDSAICAKRYNSALNIYSRYLMLVKVPVYEYEATTGQGEAPQATVLSPQCLTQSMLVDLYRDETSSTNN